MDVANIFAGSTGDIEINLNPNIIHYNKLMLTLNKNTPKHLNNGLRSINTGQAKA
jgi:hypothetical protein